MVRWYVTLDNFTPERGAPSGGAPTPTITATATATATRAATPSATAPTFPIPAAVALPTLSETYACDRLGRNGSGSSEG